MHAYSPQKLQPLDIGCFSPLKQVYGTLVEQKRYLEVKNINKFNFLKIFLAARKSAFQPETIRNNFIGASIVPFNPDRILS